MRRIHVSSSVVESIGYENRVLEIAIINDGVYQYYEVPEIIYIKLMGASSKGAFYNRHVKPFFRYAKVQES
jgi:hypothetical protein